jgi:cellulose synthase/poly-beta-1,6-N-acetylglucosamine synthase-like glycosyltransferase
LKSIPTHPEVIVLTELDNGEMTTGAKRNKLLQRAKDAGAEYCAFVDDDDKLMPTYLGEIMKALEKKPDAVGMKGWMTTEGRNRTEWRISKDLPYVKKGNVYLRHTNHLAPIKTEIALQIGYPDKTFAEDYDYAIRLKQSGLVKTEVFINQFLYHYDYRRRK